VLQASNRFWSSGVMVSHPRATLSFSPSPCFRESGMLPSQPQQVKSVYFVFHHKSTYSENGSVTS
jgi:hypothetical protein